MNGQVDQQTSEVPIAGRSAEGWRRLLPDPARFSGLYVLIGLVVLYAIWLPDTFLTRATLTSIAGDQAITLIVALGLVVALSAGQFDLSAASNLGASAVLCGYLMTKADMSWGLAIIVTLAFGALVGAVNGVLVRIGVDSFISTLGMSSVLLAVTALVSGNQFIGPFPRGFRDIATPRIGSIPIVTVYAIVLALLAWYVLERTAVGRRHYATGANPDAARLAGVRTHRYALGSLVVAAVFASAAGILVAARIGQVSPQLGLSYLLPAFAACFLGATQIKAGRFNVWGTVLSIYLLATGVKGLQLAGGQLWVTDMFNGVALIGAVTMSVIGRKRREARLRERARRAEGFHAAS